MEWERGYNKGFGEEPSVLDNVLGTISQGRALHFSCQITTKLTGCQVYWQSGAASC